MFFGPLRAPSAAPAAGVQADDTAEMVVQSGRFTVVTSPAEPSSPSKLFKPFRDGEELLTPSTAATIKDPWADARPAATGLAKPFREDLEGRRLCKERCAYFLP
jgi:hypothetical protein